jgi:ribonuclease BN (tRNA processing enzyme)
VEARLLGSGGWIPTDARETACVLVRAGTHALVLDAGSGLRRLVTEPDLLAGIERLSIVLTHFHLDHTIGLLYMPALRHVPERDLWAPGRLLFDTPAKELVHRLLDPPFLASEAKQLTAELFTRIEELPGEVELDSFRLETRVQPKHAGPTLAFKLDGELAYCTDTAYDPENAAFVRGARVLLHEAFHAADETDDPIHSAAGEAARIAEAGGVGRLVLVHVHPLQRDEEELLGFARKRFPASEVGRDRTEV